MSPHQYLPVILIKWFYKPNQKCLLEKIQEKLFDFDVNKKNNLIFNGVARITNEDDEKLTAVIRDIIKRKMKILRFVDIAVTQSFSFQPLEDD